MILYRLAFFSIIFFSLTQQAVSQDVRNLINIRNAGAFSCETFLPILSDPTRQVERTAFINWAGAYTTAASRANSIIDMFPIADTWELVRMASLICREDPSQKYEAVVREALARLRSMWTHSNPAVTTLSDPQGREVIFYNEAVQSLQRLLNQYGANIHVDGVYGNQTGGAILRLNEARGSQPWMTPDGEFLYQLTRPRQN